MYNYRIYVINKNKEFWNEIFKRNSEMYKRLKMNKDGKNFFIKLNYRIATMRDTSIKRCWLED